MRNNFHNQNERWYTRSTMRTILVFRTGTLGTWREKLGGVTAFAKAKG